MDKHVGSLDDVQVLLSERIAEKHRNQQDQRPASQMQQAEEFFDDAEEENEYDEEGEEEEVFDENAPKTMLQSRSVMSLSELRPEQQEE